MEAPQLWAVGHRNVARAMGFDQIVHRLLALGAQARGSLVEDHKVQVFLQEQAGKADALDLAQRQAVGPVHVPLLLGLVPDEALEGLPQVDHRAAVRDRVPHPPPRPLEDPAEQPPALLHAGGLLLFFMVEELDEGAQARLRKQVVQVHQLEHGRQPLVIHVPALDAGVEELLPQRAHEHVGPLGHEEDRATSAEADAAGAVGPEAGGGTEQGALADAAVPGNEQRLAPIDLEGEALRKCLLEAGLPRRRPERHLLELQDHGAAGGQLQGGDARGAGAAELRGLGPQALPLQGLVQGVQAPDSHGEVREGLHLVHDERQPTENRVEGHAGLRDRSELDLAPQVGGAHRQRSHREGCPVEGPVEDAEACPHRDAPVDRGREPPEELVKVRELGVPALEERDGLSVLAHANEAVAEAGLLPDALVLVVHDPGAEAQRRDQSSCKGVEDDADADKGRYPIHHAGKSQDPEDGAYGVLDEREGDLYEVVDILADALVGVVNLARELQPVEDALARAGKVGVREALGQRCAPVQLEHPSHDAVQRDERADEDDEPACLPEPPVEAVHVLLLERRHVALLHGGVVDEHGALDQEDHDERHRQGDRPAARGFPKEERPRQRQRGVPRAELPGVMRDNGPGAVFEHRDA
mmetsp:Transcript_58439/g.170910  ORF Transcript_58439/g.170910 Transcript_58439/m.170910 type:complete len:641 (+) Transcript_58439:166-2088(+)